MGVAASLDPSRFGSFLNQLTQNQRANILRALDSARIESEEELKNIVDNANRLDTITILQSVLVGLNYAEASALAGRLIGVKQQVQAQPGESIILCIHFYLIFFIDYEEMKQSLNESLNESLNDRLAKLLISQPHGVSTEAEWVHSLKSERSLVSDIAFGTFLTSQQQIWWPFASRQVPDFPKLGDMESATCQPFVDNIVKEAQIDTGIKTPVYVL